LDILNLITLITIKIQHTIIIFTKINEIRVTQSVVKEKSIKMTHNII